MQSFQLPYWKDTVLGFHEMTKDEIALFPNNVTLVRHDYVKEAMKLEICI